MPKQDKSSKTRSTKSAGAQVDGKQLAALLEQLRSFDNKTRAEGLQQLENGISSKRDLAAACFEQLNKEGFFDNAVVDCIGIGSKDLMAIATAIYTASGRTSSLTRTNADGSNRELCIWHERSLELLLEALKHGMVVTPVKFVATGWELKLLTDYLDKHDLGGLTRAIVTYPGIPDRLPKNSHDQLIGLLMTHGCDIAIKAINDFNSQPAAPNAAKGGLEVVSLENGGHVVVDKGDGTTYAVGKLGPDELAGAAKKLEFELAAVRAIQAKLAS